MTALTPEERSVALEKTTVLATAHGTAATQGQSRVPDANEEIDLHFVAFVQASSAEDGKKRIVELDGRRLGPIDHGPFTDFLEVWAIQQTSCLKFLPLNLDR